MSYVHFYSLPPPSAVCALLITSGNFSFQIVYFISAFHLGLSYILCVFIMLCFLLSSEHMRHIHSSCFNPVRLASESGTFGAWILWQHFGWQETFLFVFWFLAVFRSLWLPADHVLVEKIKYGRKPGLGIAWREHVSRSVVSDSLWPHGL